MTQTRPTTVTELVADPWLGSAVDAFVQFATKQELLAEIGIIHHGDIDGAVSAGLVLAAFERLRPDIVVSVHAVATEDYDFRPLSEWLASRALDAAVMLDLSIANKPDKLAVFAGALETGLFIFDHHALNDVSFVPPKNVSFFNPWPLGSDVAPFATFQFARALAFRLGLSFPDDLMLICIFAEGVDHAFPDLAESLAAGVNRFPKAGSLRDRYKRWRSARFSTLIRAAFAIDVDQTTITTSLRALALGDMDMEEATEKLEVVFGPDADQISHMISDTVGRWRGILGSKHADRALVVIPIIGPPAVAGPVASILRGSFPKLVFLTWVRWRDRIILELRAQNDGQFDLVRALSVAAGKVGLPSYGGHPSAAGATVAPGDLNELVSALADVLQVNVLSLEASE